MTMTADETTLYMHEQLSLRLKRAGIGDVEITPANIQPSKLSSVPLEKQAKLIDAVRMHLSDSWAFFGAPGTGKTTLSNMLFKAAVIQDIFSEMSSGNQSLTPHVWRITARELCQQAQDRATGRDLVDEDTIVDTQALMKASARLVNRERIQRAVNAGLRPRLFVEEWDKISATPFQMLSLFDVLDAIIAAKGQLVMTSNLTWDEFCAMFGQVNWRIQQNCYIAQLFEKVTVTSPARAPIQPYVP
jgi:hypothetical protein